MLSKETTRNPTIIIILLSLIYTTLGIVSMNYYYFWDCIELVSKQAHWFYLYDMNPLSLPVYNDKFSMLSTVVHPPLTPYLTAVLWKIFGQHLWVSHLFSFFWAFILIYNTWGLVSFLLKKDSIKFFVLALILLESTLLTQFEFLLALFYL